MRNALMLLFIGLVAYVGYSLWNNPQEFRQRVSALFGTTATPVPAAAPVRAEAGPDAAGNLTQELSACVSSNMEAILSPLTSEEPVVGAAELGELKARLNSEFSREHTAAEKARLQAAFQLAGVMEQAIAQRAEHVKRRKSSEYGSAPRGAPLAASPNTRVSPAEASAKMRQAEFFMQGVERKWDELAAQYRATINRLMASVSA